MYPSILLHSGEYFDYSVPRDGPYHITDIAHALSNICRYTGHVSSFYSVAQHSVLVSHLCPPGLRMAGLLHDAAEAYMGDVNSPLKQLLPDYLALEEQVERALFERFCLPYEQLAQVKPVDVRMYLTERYALMPTGVLDDDYWESVADIGVPYPINIEPWQPDVAESNFLYRFTELYKCQNI